MAKMYAADDNPNPYKKLGVGVYEPKSGKLRDDVMWLTFRKYLQCLTGDETYCTSTTFKDIYLRTDHLISKTRDFSVSLKKTIESMCQLLEGESETIATSDLKAFIDAFVDDNLPFVASDNAGVHFSLFMDANGLGNKWKLTIPIPAEYTNKMRSKRASSLLTDVSETSLEDLVGQSAKRRKLTGEVDRKLSSVIEILHAHVTKAKREDERAYKMLLSGEGDILANAVKDAMKRSGLLDPVFEYFRDEILNRGAGSCKSRLFGFI